MGQGVNQDWRTGSVHSGFSKRIEREREARYNADIAAARQIAVLEEQVKTLQHIYESSSADARKARTQSLIANFISGISIAIAILALVLR